MVIGWEASWLRKRKGIYLYQGRRSHQNIGGAEFFRTPQMFLDTFNSLSKKLAFSIREDCSEPPKVGPEVTSLVDNAFSVIKLYYSVLR